MNKWYSSSANPERISLSLKAAVPLVLSIAAWYGFNVEQSDVDEVITTIVGVISGLMFLYGVGRKIFYLFAK